MCHGLKLLQASFVAPDGKASHTASNPNNADSATAGIIPPAFILQTYHCTGLLNFEREMLVFGRRKWDSFLYTRQWLSHDCLANYYATISHTLIGLLLCVIHLVSSWLKCANINFISLALRGLHIHCINTYALQMHTYEAVLLHMLKLYSITGIKGLA